MCDDRCIAVFDDKTLEVYLKYEAIHNCLSNRKRDNLVVQGYRNNRDGLYDVPFSALKANYIVQKDKSKLDLAMYLHGCAFLPAISTFQECINRGDFLLWPGIDEVKFKKYLQNLSQLCSEIWIKSG